MNGIIKRVFLFPILIFFFTSNFLTAQDISTNDYVKIIQLKNPLEKIDSLNKFRTEYPSSRYFEHSLTQTFSAYVQLGNPDSAIVYADKFLSKLPEASKESYYNNFAYQLAEKKIGLDSAKSFINKAVALAKSGHSRRLISVLNTQAFVLFNTGKIDSALAIQKELVNNNGDNPEFVTNLAIYQEASGDINSALNSIAKAILLGKSESSINYFNSWLEKQYPDTNQREKAKTNVAKETVNEYLKTDSSAMSKSTAAVFLAGINTELKTAKKYAVDAVSKIDTKTTIEDLIKLRLNLGTVENAQGKYKEALNELLKIESYAAPWDTEYWYLVGNIYEKLGKKDKGFDAYLFGSIFPEENPIAAAVDRIAKEKGLSKEDVENKIEKIKDGMKDFDLGKFKRKGNSKKVVVAELFTGAECPPCVAADHAFDKLSEYYSQNDVVILEYHVHIPGPDPITNQSSFSKYGWYGGNFGTPTVFLDGVENIGGGGPDFVAKNRASVYLYSLDKYLNEQPGVNITGSAVLQNDKVNLNLGIEQAKEDLSNCFVQIALIEKSIDYTGANGVNKHIYVVRHLVNNADGIKTAITGGKQTITETIDIAQVESGIKKYLDDPTTDSSWRPGTRFSGWKSRPDTINRSNLAVVVYVQNAETKKILQAKYFDLSSSTN